MTEAIFSLFGRPRKPRLEPTEDERRMELLRYRVRQLGDRVREMNDWKDGYRLRTGRAA